MSTSPFVPASEYLKLPRAPETWLIDQLIPTSGSALLYGDPKVGKSYAALQLASNLTTGAPWLSFRVNQRGPVAYIQLDTPRSLWAERIAIVERAGFPLEGVQFADLETLDTFPFDVLNPTHHALVKDALAALPTPPIAVVIDTVLEAHPADENDSTAMKAVVAQLKSLTHPAAMILIAHARKAFAERDPDLINDNRGSSYLVSRMDAIIRVSRKSMHYIGRAIEEGRITCERTDEGLWIATMAEVDDAIASVLADPTLSTDTDRAKVLSTKLGRTPQAARRLIQKRGR